MKASARERSSTKPTTHPTASTVATEKHSGLGIKQIITTKFRNLHKKSTKFPKFTIEEKRRSKNSNKRDDSQVIVYSNSTIHFNNQVNNFNSSGGIITLKVLTVITAIILFILAAVITLIRIKRSRAEDTDSVKVLFRSAKGSDSLADEKQTGKNNFFCQYSSRSHPGP